MNNNIDKLELIKSSIRTIPNFPKEGIMFKDITTLLNNQEAFKSLIDILEDRYKSFNLDYIAGIDARGFIFGSALASRLNLGFVPIRKKGKLPFKTISEEYSLEYGKDAIEMHIDAFNNKDGARVLLIDDLLATGGTASAGERLIKKAKGEVAEVCFIIELAFLNGRDKLSSPIFSLIVEK